MFMSWLKVQQFGSDSQCYRWVLTLLYHICHVSYYWAFICWSNISDIYAKIARICTKIFFWGFLKGIHLSGLYQYMIRVHLFGQIMKLGWDLWVYYIDIILRKYHTRLAPYLCIYVYNKLMDMCYKKYFSVMALMVSTSVWSTRWQSGMILLEDEPNR